MKVFYRVDKRTGKRNNVGELLPSGEFRKNVAYSKHFMRICESYGIAADVAEDLGKMGCNLITLFDTEHQEMWTVPYDKFIKHSAEKKFAPYEKQRFLPARFWDIIQASTGTMVQEGAVA